MLIRSVRFTAKTFLAIALVASIALNIATITITSVHAAISSAASAIGLSTVAARNLANTRAASETRKITNRIAQRTTKRVSERTANSTGRSIASSFGEAVPIVGIGIIAASIGLEVKDACDTAKDMAGLEGALNNPDDPEKGRQKAIEQFSCTDLIPSIEDIPTKEELLSSVSNAPSEAWESASTYYENLPDVDWAAYANTARSLASEMMDWVWGEN